MVVASVCVCNFDETDDCAAVGVIFCKLQIPNCDLYDLYMASGIVTRAGEQALIFRVGASANDSVREEN